MLKSLENIDILLFYFINITTKNNIFDFLMPIVTNTKNFYLIFFILFLLMIISKKYRLAALSIFISLIFCDILSSKILKYIFLRPRPYEVLGNVAKLVSSAGPSFPSSHAMNSFFVATLIKYFFNKKIYSFFAYFLAFLSSYSRIYVGVHYPSDVFFGAIFGIFLGIFFYKIIIKFFIKKFSNNHLSTYKK